MAIRMIGSKHLLVEMREKHGAFMTHRSSLSINLMFSKRLKRGYKSPKMLIKTKVQVKEVVGVAYSTKTFGVIRGKSLHLLWELSNIFNQILDQISTFRFPIGHSTILIRYIFKTRELNA